MFFRFTPTNLISLTALAASFPVSLAAPSKPLSPPAHKSLPLTYIATSYLVWDVKNVRAVTTNQGQTVNSQMLSYVHLLPGIHYWKANLITLNSGNWTLPNGKLLATVVPGYSGEVDTIDL